MLGWSVCKEGAGEGGSDSCAPVPARQLFIQACARLPGAPPLARPCCGRLPLKCLEEAAGEGGPGSVNPHGLPWELGFLATLHCFSWELQEKVFVETPFICCFSVIHEISAQLQFSNFNFLGTDCLDKL